MLDVVLLDRDLLPGFRTCDFLEVLSHLLELLSHRPLLLNHHALLLYLLLQPENLQVSGIHLTEHLLVVGYLQIDQLP